jgi:hypothetical protein
MTSRWTLPQLRKSLTRKQRVQIFMKTDGRCHECGQRLEIKGWDAHHPQALALLGPDDIDALVPLCKPCHKVDTADDVKTIAKCKRVRDKHIGAKKSKSPLPFGRDSPLKKKMDGSVVKRETGEPA